MACIDLAGIVAGAIHYLAGSEEAIRNPGPLPLNDGAIVRRFTQRVLIA